MTTSLPIGRPLGTRHRRAPGCCPMGSLWPLTQCMDLERDVFETSTEFEIRATQASIFNNEDDAMKTAAPTMTPHESCRWRDAANSATQMWPARLRIVA